MDNVENQVSCLVNSGIVYSKRDMIRILRDLDRVKYVDFVDNSQVASGEGYVIDVYANGFDSTLIFNDRLHINVNGFDYLKIKSEPGCAVELVSNGRIIKLKPLAGTYRENSRIEEEIDEKRIIVSSQLACDNEVDIGY